MQAKPNGRRRDPKLTKTGTAGVYKRGTRYVYSFTGPDGRRRWGSARTLTEARNLRASRVTDVSRGEFVDDRKLTLAQYVERWLVSYQGRTGRGVRPATLAKYADDLNRHVLPVLGRRRLASITPQDVKAVATKLRNGGLGPATVRNALAPLRAVLATAAEEGLLRGNPASVVRLPGPDEDRVKALEDAELAALLAQAPEGRDGVLLHFLAGTGVRVSEALGARWGDVDLKEGVLTVAGQVQGGERTRTKTRKGERVVKLPAGLVGELRRHRMAARHSGDGDPVFATLTGRPMSRHQGWRVVRATAERAGLPAWVSPHSLRHSYARRLLVGGVQVRMVSTLLGHTDPAFTMRRYAKFLPSDVRALDLDFLGEAGSN